MGEFFSATLLGFCHLFNFGCTPGSMEASDPTELELQAEMSLLN